MKRDKYIFNNERGAALLLAMVILVVLTLIGIAAVNTSTTEIALSANYKTSQEAFYISEGGLESVIGNDTNITGTATVSDFNVSVGSKQATVGITYLTSGTTPPGSGTGIRTSLAANYYLIKSTANINGGKSVQEEMVAKLVPAN